MVTREQLNDERLRAILRLISEENESPAGELPTPDYLIKLQTTRDFGEAEKFCEYCRKAGEHLSDREN